MNKHEEIKKWEAARDSHQCIIDDLKRQIAEEWLPKPRRWYTNEEFIAFMFAYPVILVRNADGYVRTGRPSASSSSTYFSTALYNIDDGNFTTFTYSTDGKTWQAFGVVASQ